MSDFGHGSVSDFGHGSVSDFGIGSVSAVGRLLRGALLGLLGAVAIGAPALADPAGPTDYLSEITGIDPATPTIELEVIGGDSFVRLFADDGTEVVVVGYQGEDYLWFQSDGSVWENRNSPSTYVNEERYGGDDIPPNASADAEPDWVEVGSNGTYAWHDHRAHWMQRSRPLGAGPGDQILEAVVPLRVDGGEVDVTVISTWQPAASSIPAWIGVGLGLAAVAGAWALRRAAGPTAAVTIPMAIVATIAGVAQFTSLPAETDPRLLWWALPVIALVCAVGGLVAHLRGATFVADGALLVVGVELAIWGWIKVDGLGAALIPTSAPGWFDRLATSLALVGGIGVAAVAVWSLFAVSFSGSREPTDSPLPARP